MVDGTKAIDAGLQRLEALDEKLLAMTMNGLQSNGGALFLLDLIAVAAAKRAIALSSGFRAMIKSRNMACAGALLRVHLDTTIRIQAVTLVENPQEFAEQFYSGTQIRHMKDRTGAKMTDRYLVNQLVKDFPDLAWLDNVYEETSGYIHLSNTHLFSIFGSVDPNNRTVELEVGAKDASFPDEIYIEAIEAMVASTRLLLDYQHGWKTSRTGEFYPGASANDTY